MQIGYSVIDLETGDRLHFGGESAVVDLPDGGRAHFTAVGQTEPGHAPRYRMVEAHELSDRPAYPFLITEETRVYANGRDEITRTYASDVSAYQRAIEAHIDAVAVERGYSSGVFCASYVSSTNADWQAEAEVFIAWRDAVWTYAFAQLALVQAAERAVPTVEAFIAELPVIEWP